MRSLPRSRHLAVLALAGGAAALVLPTAPARAQHSERATGTVTIERPPPEPRGFTVEQVGRPLTAWCRAAAPSMPRAPMSWWWMRRRAARG
jgi:hypothetical protein